MRLAPAVLALLLVSAVDTALHAASLLALLAALVVAAVLLRCLLDIAWGGRRG